MTKWPKLYYSCHIYPESKLPQTGDNFRAWSSQPLESGSCISYWHGSRATRTSTQIKSPRDDGRAKEQPRQSPPKAALRFDQNVAEDRRWEEGRERESRMGVGHTGCWAQGNQAGAFQKWLLNTSCLMKYDWNKKEV